ncbi:MAG: hypothetical protein ABIN74_02635 [Ferruginibacter sp.]
MRLNKLTAKNRKVFRKERKATYRECIMQNKPEPATVTYTVNESFTG